MACPRSQKWFPTLRSRSFQIAAASRLGSRLAEVSRRDLIVLVVVPLRSAIFSSWRLIHAMNLVRSVVCLGVRCFERGYLEVELLFFESHQRLDFECGLYLVACSRFADSRTFEVKSQLPHCH